MAYSLSPLLKPRFFVNATNKPLVGGKLYTYLAETTTPATTYSNDTGTPNTNPIILDANGDQKSQIKFTIMQANFILIITMQ